MLHTKEHGTIMKPLLNGPDGHRQERLPLILSRKRWGIIPLVYYIQTSAIGLGITLIISFHMLIHNAERSASRRIFWGLILSNMLLLVLELLLNTLTGNSADMSRTLLPVIVFLFYMMNPVPEALWVLYLDAIIRKNAAVPDKRLVIAVSIPFILNLLLALLSLSGGQLFTIDADNVYHRGPYFALMLLCCYGYLLYMLLLIYVKRKSLQMNELVVSIFAALLPVVAGAIQSLFYGISLIWIALSFSLLIAYINLQNEQVYRELRALNRMKDEFLANTSHELRTPLNGIINITSTVMESSVNTLDDRQRHNLRIVISSAKRLSRLINDILDISSMKSGELRLQKSAVQLHSIVESVLDMLRRSASNKETVLINRIPQELPPIHVDMERLYQIFYNLVGNAQKFTSSGRIELGAALGEQQVQIWVEDTGCGIPADKLGSIFQPFYQVDAGLGRETGGTGLGLAITKNLVELHGGTIQVVSTEGQGSRFTFTLPISRTDLRERSMQPEPARQPAAYEVVVAMEEWLPTGSEPEERRYAVLAVDDDPTSLTALYHILELEGYYVKAVSSGEAALEELRHNGSYDLMVLDVMMPRMSGYEVLEQIRQRFEPVDMPVLLLTAKARPEDLLAGFEAGASDYLSKPFEAVELRARVKTLVQLKESVSMRLETEMSFLQAQIKPHFLYNSLSVIAALSTQEPQRAEQLLYDLSDYLRGSFQFDNYEGVTFLSSELATVRAYVSLEQARFRDTLHVVFDVDDEIDIPIPMLVVQPLVENAIRHGVSKKPGGGAVSLSVQRGSGNTVITVADNGVGMTEATWRELLNGQVPGQGVGLQNIQRRMIVRYGHGLEIQSAVGAGTSVTLRIPD